MPPIHGNYNGLLRRYEIPIQIYQCPEHGEFEVETKITEDIESVIGCPVFEVEFNEPCNFPSLWVPSAPNFIGGPTTGAKKE